MQIFEVEIVSIKAGASNWTKGVYLVVMEGKGSRQVVKVLKE